MKVSRRAVPDGAASVPGAVLRGVVVGLTTALVGTAAMASFVAGRMARRVVTPAERIPDTRILDVDTAAQTITLARTLDTILPGRYGLMTRGTQRYVKLGTVLQSDADTVTRKLLTEIGPGDRLAAEAAFSGWYFDRPEQLQLPFSDEEIEGDLGPCPAWLFPAEEMSDVWVIQIHGRGTTRAECLRAVPVFRAAGITSLVVSYRNDGDAPRSRGGSYSLGATEWRDVEHAVAWARAHGARRIVLMGWSMGGAIALQVALNSAHREEIVGLILESPVIDWRRVLTYQARLARVPEPVARLAIRALGREWLCRLTGADAAIPFDSLDLLTRAAELQQPTLILHSDDDDFVPSEGSVGLGAARPDLVELQRFETARHTKLWNYDPERWARTITDWLERRGLAGPEDAGS